MSSPTGPEVGKAPSTPPPSTTTVTTSPQPQQAAPAPVQTVTAVPEVQQQVSDGSEGSSSPRRVNDYSSPAREESAEDQQMNEPPAAEPSSVDISFKANNSGVQVIKDTDTLSVDDLEDVLLELNKYEKSLLSKDVSLFLSRLSGVEFHHNIQFF